MSARSATTGLPGGRLRCPVAGFERGRPAELYAAAYGDPGLPPGFVAFPEADPQRPPPHLTGGTVDLTLRFDGTPLALGTGFDGFTAHAKATAFEDTPGTVRELRLMLFWAVQTQDFVLLTFEWWHFEFGTWRWAAIRGVEPIYGSSTR